MLCRGNSVHSFVPSHMVLRHMRRPQHATRFDPSLSRLPFNYRVLPCLVSVCLPAGRLCIPLCLLALVCGVDCDHVVYHLLPPLEGGVFELSFIDNYCARGVMAIFLSLARCRWDRSVGHWIRTCASSFRRCRQL